MLMNESIVKYDVTFADGERALYVVGVAVRTRPHGRAPAVDESAKRLHNVPATEAGGGNREYCSAGQSTSRLCRPHFPVLRVCEREFGEDCTGLVASRSGYSPPVDCHSDCVRTGEERERGGDCSRLNVNQPIYNSINNLTYLHT